MKTKQIMSKSMRYGGPDAFSLTSVGHFLMKILNLEKKVENCAGTVWKALKFSSEISEDSITPRNKIFSKHPEIVSEFSLWVICIVSNIKTALKMFHFINMMFAFL